MGRLTRAIIAVLFIAVIAVSAISITQNVGRSLRVDITDQKLYTLSDGTKAILQGLNQPIRIKLYYTKTAAMKGPDQIRFFNNYYIFVKSLLDEYVRAANGKMQLEVIDPRPYSDEEMDAIRYGLKRFAINEEENFFFGMVCQTQFGVEKTIDFFSPDRQNFVEYDISYLIDSAVRRQKTRIGIISSLSLMGDTGYMAQMMAAQGRQPRPQWGLVKHLRQSYEVTQLENDVDEIKDVDILLVIHPKELSEKTQFAIDQFVLKGGRTIVCVDPHCVADRPDPMAMQMGRMSEFSSNLPQLLKAWGLEMPANTFAGDRGLAVTGSLRPNERPQKIIGILSLLRQEQCFNQDTAMTADLNKVNMMFPGVLKKIEAGEGETLPTLTPLLMTTDKGNSWKVSSPYELSFPDHAAFLQKFTEGTVPVNMGYLVTGKLKSAFPNGIQVEDESADDDDEDDSDDDDAEKEGKKMKTITGLTESTEDCAVIVFSDVDFISDIVAYRDTFFGTAVVDDNASLMLNAIEDLSGSSNLIAIRSRGNFKRPFTVVDEIERKAEEQTAGEEAKIQAEITGFQQKLSEILSSARAEEGKIVETKILNEKMEVEAKIRELERQLRLVKSEKRVRIESLGVKLRNLCTLPGPAIILLIAVALGVRRSMMKRHYISHASDA
ncbi:MAG TPA: Gldg family protein [Anaerohalosphaeraceae bacterium]|jgi:ABC-2 type transport system permease protein|nr:Gldg family protein [Anaerohalosphaeraceae bacterium]HRT52320.1 Gldg family protein [Anaerohalosphaeraceae bacterium]HRT87974.1 Gldg family protein [Anaerohalosphaeraceae bacterium]